jgi:8-oxo-dGTP pyrophosphatase MutT (NUDIX family)
MIRQYGALSYDVPADGEPRFLLITSRTSRRWIIPRGNPIRKLSPAQSAAQEAYEEAGITGLISPAEIGSYRYIKRRPNGTEVLANVHVFAMLTTKQSAHWPERDQRDWKWFSRLEAVEAVDEPELKQLIGSFTPPPTETLIPVAKLPAQRSALRSLFSKMTGR